MSRWIQICFLNMYTFSFPFGMYIYVFTDKYVSRTSSRPMNYPSFLSPLSFSPSTLAFAGSAIAHAAAQHVRSFSYRRHEEISSTSPLSPCLAALDAHRRKSSRRFLVDFPSPHTNRHTRACTVENGRRNSIAFATPSNNTRTLLR